MTVNVVTVDMKVDGTGEALDTIKGQSPFGLTKVSLEGQQGEVTWVPDPDNDANIIIWVRDAIPGAVHVFLTYPEL